MCSRTRGWQIAAPSQDGNTDRNVFIIAMPRIRTHSIWLQLSWLGTLDINARLGYFCMTCNYYIRIYYESTGFWLVGSRVIIMSLSPMFSFHLVWCARTCASCDLYMSYVTFTCRFTSILTVTLTSHHRWPWQHHVTQSNDVTLTTYQYFDFSWNVNVNNYAYLSDKIIVTKIYWHSVIPTALLQYAYYIWKK